MMRRTIVLTVLINMVLMTGCGLKVMKLNPQPNVVLNASSESLKLKLGGKIDDTQILLHPILPKDAALKTNLNEWRGTLVTGFENAFSDYYQLKSEDEVAEYTLKIIQTKITFNPTSFTGGLITSFRTQITFSAQLLDSQNKTISSCAETATSKVLSNNASDTQLNIQSAVESMYEIIAQKIMSQL